MYSKVRKSLFCLVVMLLVLGASLWAQELRWSLPEAPSHITAVRYQVDSESPDGWTVITPDTRVVVTGPHKVGTHTFYFQWSRDGVTWSGSAKAEATVVARKEVASVDVQRSMVGSQSIEIAVGTGGRADNRWFTDFFVSNSNNATGYDLRTRILPAVSVDYVISGLRKVGTFDLGLRSGIGVHFNEMSSDGLKSVPFFDFHVLPKFDLWLGEALVAEAAFGASLVLGTLAEDIANGPNPPFAPGDRMAFLFGPAVQVGLSYLVSDTLSLGIQAETRMLLTSSFEPYDLTGVVRAKVGYSF